MRDCVAKIVFTAPELLEKVLQAHRGDSGADVAEIIVVGGDKHSVNLEKAEQWLSARAAAGQQLNDSLVAAERPSSS